jgi:hypothetical protein
VRLDFDDDQTLLVVWTLPGRDFVCVEPWRAGPGALACAGPPVLPPGGAAQTTLTITSRG